MHRYTKIAVVFSTLALLVIGGEATVYAQSVTVTKKAGSPGAVLGKTIFIYPNASGRPSGVHWKDAWIRLKVVPGTTTVSSSDINVKQNGTNVVLHKRPTPRKRTTHSLTVGSDTYTVVLLPHRCFPYKWGGRVYTTCRTKRTVRARVRRNRCPAPCLKEIDKNHGAIRKLSRRHDEDIDAIRRKLLKMQRDLDEAKAAAKRGNAKAAKRAKQIEGDMDELERRLAALEKKVAQNSQKIRDGGGSGKGSRKFDWNLYGGVMLKVYGPGKPIGVGPFAQFNALWAVNDSRSIYLGLGLRASGIFQQYELLDGGMDFEDPYVSVQIWRWDAMFHFEWRPSKYFALAFDIGFGTATEYHGGRVTSYPHGVEERLFTFPEGMIDLELIVSLKGLRIKAGIGYHQPFMKRLDQPNGVAYQAAEETFLGALMIYVGVGL